MAHPLLHQLVALAGLVDDMPTGCELSMQPDRVWHEPLMVGLQTHTR